MGWMNSISRHIKKITFILFSIILLTSTFTWMIENVSATAAPVLITPANGSYTSDNTPTATWSSVPGATNYNIQISTESDFTPLLGEDSTPSTSFTASPALPD